MGELLLLLGGGAILIFGGILIRNFSIQRKIAKVIDAMEIRLNEYPQISPKAARDGAAVHLYEIHAMVTSPLDMIREASADEMAATLTRQLVHDVGLERNDSYDMSGSFTSVAEREHYEGRVSVLRRILKLDP